MKRMTQPAMTAKWADVKMTEIASLDKLLQTSEFLAAVKRIRERKTKGKVINDELQKQLELNRCWSDDWSKVRVADGFNAHHVFDAKFFGECYLGTFTKSPVKADDGVSLSPGVYNSVIINSDVEDDALVYNAGVVSNYVIGKNAVVTNTRSLSCNGNTAFGNGAELAIAIETGGRETLSYADMTIPVAEIVAKKRADTQMQQQYQAFVAKYVEAARSEKGIIEEGARITNTGKVINTFVGSYAIIDNATKVSDCTLLSTEEEKTKVLDGAWVSNSILQWGCEVGSMAMVDTSVMTEHSHVERHGKVTHSILGPNTGVAEGEVTSCLCGPFVGFHHQSLLIAALWPEGKGNVGYGANVGSNHTSKAPDQEIWPGEGMFFGLGVNVKFPCDFTSAPYTILASGVTLLPQKVTYPFSLIVSSDATHEGISPAYNEIIPAWVLSDNIYAVKRNEGKYEKRNKARRTKFVFEVFRPDIIDMMVKGRDMLRAVRDDRMLAQREVKDFYIDRDIRGLGKNYLKEEARLRAIDSYTFYLQYYALSGLRRRFESLLQSGEQPQLQEMLDKESTGARWEHERVLLQRELPGKGPVELLHMLVAHQEKIAIDVQHSKEKDDHRGVRVIPDYIEAHKPAADDVFVKETHEATKNLKAAVSGLLAKIQSQALPRT